MVLLQVTSSTSECVAGCGQTEVRKATGLCPSGAGEGAHTQRQSPPIIGSNGLSMPARVRASMAPTGPTTPAAPTVRWCVKSGSSVAGARSPRFLVAPGPYDFRR